MDYKDNTIKLYSSQSDTVLGVIRRDGRCFSRAEYVRRKYGESAPIFLTAYHWFVKEACRIVPIPDGTEFPYWAFQDLYSIDQSGDNKILSLSVPSDQVVLFDMYDWNKIMCMKYIGENERAEKDFHASLAECGLKETDVMLTNFYPEWKEKIIKSWSRLFRHHEQIMAGNTKDVGSVQAGLWQIKTEWIVSR